MLKLDQLLILTPTSVVNDATGVELISLDTVKLPKSFLVLAHARGKGEEDYRVVLEVHKTKKLDMQKRAWVWCSCPSYMFRLEYPNHKVGSGPIIYSNGEEPTKYKTPGLCKHLCGTIDRVLGK